MSVGGFASKANAGLGSPGQNESYRRKGLPVSRSNRSIDQKKKKAKNCLIRWQRRGIFSLLCTSTVSSQAIWKQEVIEKKERKKGKREQLELGKLKEEERRGNGHLIGRASRVISKIFFFPLIHCKPRTPLPPHWSHSAHMRESHSSYPYATSTNSQEFLFSFFLSQQERRNLAR